MNLTPTQIEPYSSTELRVVWNDGQEFALPYIEMRFYCPCAGCVDEHTGQRTLQRSSLDPEVRPLDVQLIGKYAIQITWSDQHNTGMYHFDRIFELCQKQGKKL